MWRRKWLPSGLLLLRPTSAFAHGNPSFFSKETASFGTTTVFGHGFITGNPSFFPPNRSEEAVSDSGELWRRKMPPIGNPSPFSRALLGPAARGNRSGGLNIAAFSSGGLGRRFSSDSDKTKRAALPIGNPIPFSRALLGLAARGNRSRGVNFPVFSSGGVIRHFSSDADSDKTKRAAAEEDTISFAEAKRLMRLVNVEGLKAKLGAEGKEVISYYELLEACESIGVARSSHEAAAFAKILDEAGVVLLFRDKVYLHPDKVVDLVRRAVPLALTADDDPIRNELRSLQEKKEEIDMLAHRQVRRVLWTGLVGAMLQVGLFFRLTFWEFSWDVMEPIAFFTTASGLVIGYAYFLITSRDPTYQDLMKRLFLNRQRKLFRKYDFDCERFKELQRKCKHHLDAASCIRNRVGMDLELDDALHRD